MARATAVEGLGEIGAARWHDRAPKLFFDAIAEKCFLTRERDRRLELAVGKLREAFSAAGDADIFFNEVVIGFDVFVAERPVLTVAVQ
jgi:hypothetical protein